MCLINARWQFLIFPSTESTLCSAARLTEALHQHLKLYLKAVTLLRAGLTDDAVLFQAFAALPVEGQPTPPQLVQLHQHFFLQDFPTASGNAEALHSAVPRPAPCFDADDRGGMICKHCCIF